KRIKQTEKVSILGCTVKNTSIAVSGFNAVKEILIANNSFINEVDILEARGISFVTRTDTEEYRKNENIFITSNVFRKMFRDVTISSVTENVFISNNSIFDFSDLSTARITSIFVGNLMSVPSKNIVIENNTMVKTRENNLAMY